MSVILNNTDIDDIIAHFNSPKLIRRDLELFINGSRGVKIGKRFLDKYMFRHRARCTGGEGRNFFEYLQDWLNAWETGDFKSHKIYPCYQKIYLIKEHDNPLSLLRSIYSLHERMPQHFSPNIMVSLIETLRSINPNITKVFDPCAGWGGRLLGSVQCGLHYKGLDTNIALENSYRGLIDELKTIPKYQSFKMKFIVADCMEYQITKPLQCIVTSPPYFNIEKYPNTPIRSRHEWTQWYIQFFEKYYGALMENGLLALNIPESIYEILMTIRPADVSIPFQKVERKTTNYKEFFYIWIK